jgi:uncharacterized protein (TIGR00251 family)
VPQADDGLPTARLHLTVSPGARQDEAVWSPEGKLRVRVAAPPVEGKANKAVLAFLSRALEIAPSRIAILRGGASSHKVIQIQGLTREAVHPRLGW